LARVRVAGDGAGRDADHDVVGGLAGLLVALAGLAVLGEVVAVVAEVEEGIEVGVGLEDDGAAGPAVAAARAAHRLVLRAAERGGARAALAAADGDRDVIDELHRGWSVVRGPLF